MIDFCVYGNLVAKQSTKFFINKKTGKVFTYTPKEIKRWQDRVLAAALPYKPDALLAGPLGLEVTFNFITPKSMIKKTKPIPEWKHTKPDNTNLVKGVEDALEKVFFANDAQIAHTVINKKYTDGAEYVRIRLYELIRRQE